MDKLLKQGELPVKVCKRALALLGLDQGHTYKSVAETVRVSPATVSSWATNYRARGLLCLQDRLRSGRPVEIDGVSRAKITALACSDPPAGYSRWTLRLLAEKAVELDYCDSISHTQVANILKKTN